MTDQRNIAHDKKVARDKKAHGEAVVEGASIVPQPGKKPLLIDEDTGPSNSVAKEMYKDGAEPRVHRDDDEDGNSDGEKGDSEKDNGGGKRNGGT